MDAFKVTGSNELHDEQGAKAGNTERDQGKAEPLQACPRSTMAYFLRLGFYCSLPLLIYQGMISFTC